jgi:4a-hydroxytetrahydrobiopterin dehydratase
MARSHAVLALIGRSWMPSKAERRSRGGGARTGEVSTVDDWLVEELRLARSSPLEYPEDDRYKLTERRILPIFIDNAEGFLPFHIPEDLKYISEIHAERIDYAAWPSAIGPMVERIAIELNLKKRPDADEYPKPDSAKARTQPLSELELNTILGYENYEGWYLDNFGNTDVRYLVKTYKFRDFNRASDFMKLVSDHCRVLDHHPEWRNEFNHVTVSLTTWDAKRKVTIYDLNLALFMNKAASAVALPSSGGWSAPAVDRA